MVLVRILIWVILIGRLVYGVTIYPPIIHAELKDGVIAREIRITNDSLKKKRYLVRIVGDERYGRYSIEKNIRAFPRMVSIGPKKSKSVRVRVSIDELEDGEYKGYIVLEEKPINIDYGNGDQEMKGIEMKAKALGRYWIGIYATSGEVDRGVEIEGRLVDGSLETEVSSIGNASQSIYVRIVGRDDRDDTVSTEFFLCRVGRGEKKRIVEPIIGIEDIDVTRLEYYVPDIERDKERILLWGSDIL